MEAFIGIVGFLAACLIVASFIANIDHKQYNGVPYNNPLWMQGVDIKKKKS